MRNLKLKLYRQAKGLTQEDMARKINMSPNTYAKKEAGQTRFYVDEAYAVSRVLGKSIDDIFFNQNVS